MVLVNIGNCYYLFYDSATVITIQSDLPKDAKKEWNQRGQYDYVVLMDWDSSANNSKPGSPLASLKDAIYKV